MIWYKFMIICIETLKGVWDRLLNFLSHTTRLDTLLRPSVGWSFDQSVGPSHFNFSLFQRLRVVFALLLPPKCMISFFGQRPGRTDDLSFHL